MNKKFHTPVLTKEVLHFLDVKKDKNYIDATVGGGGHTLKIIKAGGKVLGIDHDPEALYYAKQRLRLACPSQTFKLVKGNFANVGPISTSAKFKPVAGILFDLGASTHQLTSKSRGFSFDSDTPLDMRMDPDLAVTAQDLINGLGKKELYALFTKYAQEERARAIVRRIINARLIKPIATTGELVKIIEQAYPRKRGRLHPATKVFQALRIAVNDELNNLKSALPQALDLLKTKGRLVVISFHQGEDKIVKDFFNQNTDKLKILTRKPTTATQEEINKNLNSRSAKLRAAQKIRSSEPVEL